MYKYKIPYVLWSQSYYKWKELAKGKRVSESVWNDCGYCEHVDEKTEGKMSTNDSCNKCSLYPKFCFNEENLSDEKQLPYWFFLDNKNDIEERLAAARSIADKIEADGIKWGYIKGSETF